MLPRSDANQPHPAGAFAQQHGPWVFKDVTVEARGTRPTGRWSMSPSRNSRPANFPPAQFGRPSVSLGITERNFRGRPERRRPGGMGLAASRSTSASPSQIHGRDLRAGLTPSTRVTTSANTPRTATARPAAPATVYPLGGYTLLSTRYFLKSGGSSCPGAIAAAAAAAGRCAAIRSVRS
jgi:outer membrane protein insertion porin family